MSVAPSCPQSHPQVFPLHLVASLVVLTVLSAYLLIPRERELMERLIADGLHDRALELSGLDGGSVSGVVERLLAHHQGRLSRDVVEKLQLLMSLATDPESVYGVVFANKGRFSDVTKRRFFDRLAVRCLQMGKPKLASRIYLDLSAELPLEEAQLRRAVAAARYSADPQLGITFLSNYLSGHGMEFTEFPDDLRKLMVALSREVNRGDRAFELLAEELRQCGEEGKRRTLIEELAKVSMEANRFEDAIPVIHRYVEATEAGRLSLEELARRPRTAHPSDGDFRKYARMLAMHCEWNLKTDQAFDLYRRMALVGDLEALDRCVTITPWIMRQEELTDLLASVCPVPGRPEYSLFLAKLEGVRAEFPRAEGVLRGLLRADGEDAKVWGELGHVLNEQERFAEAIEAYETAAGLDPVNRAELAIRAARLHVTLSQFDEALALYKEVPEEGHTRKSCEDASAVARVLGDAQAFEDFRWIMMERFHPPSGIEFLEIASVWDSEGHPDRADEVLREAHEICPESDVVVLERIDRRIRRKQFDEAFELLVQFRDPSDLRYTVRLIGVAVEAFRAEEAIAHLNLPDPQAKEWGPVERLELASLYEKAGHTEDALRIYEEVPGGEPGWHRLHAEMAYVDGRLSDALEHQKRYLSSLGTPDADAWMFLGDLQRAAGSVTESDEAYVLALNFLKSQTAFGAP